MQRGASFSIEHLNEIYPLKLVAITAIAFNDLKVIASNDLNKDLNKDMNKESQN